MTIDEIQAMATEDGIGSLIYLDLDEDHFDITPTERAALKQIQGLLEKAFEIINNI